MPVLVCGYGGGSRSDICEMGIHGQTYPSEVSSVRVHNVVRQSAVAWRR